MNALYCFLTYLLMIIPFCVSPIYVKIPHRSLLCERIKYFTLWYQVEIQSWFFPQSAEKSPLIFKLWPINFTEFNREEFKIHDVIYWTLRIFSPLYITTKHAQALSLDKVYLSYRVHIIQDQLQPLLPIMRIQLHRINVYSLWFQII